MSDVINIVIPIATAVAGVLLKGTLDWAKKSGREEAEKEQSAPRAPLFGVAVEAVDGRLGNLEQQATAMQVEIRALREELRALGNAQVQFDVTVERNLRGLDARLLTLENRDG